MAEDGMKGSLYLILLHLVQFLFFPVISPYKNPGERHNFIIHHSLLDIHYSLRNIMLSVYAVRTEQSN
jgi:hypothetical protein